MKALVRNCPRAGASGQYITLPRDTKSVFAVPLCISQSTFLFWGEILHYFCFVLGCLLSLSLLTRGNKRNKQKQGISCLVAIDIGLTALQRARHLRLEWKRVPPPLGQTRGPRGSQSAHQSSLIGSIHPPDTAVSRLTKSEF